MPLLRLLDPQPFSAPILDLLARNSIRTWEDLLISDLVQMREECNDRDARLCDEAHRIVLSLCHQKSQWRPAGEILSGLTREVYSFGCASLDGVLAGGAEAGSLLEVVGAEGSGKTQVCLSLAASTALRTKGAVLYVDTSASFSSHRLTDILGGLTGATDLLESRWSDCSRAMKCIVCARCGDIFSALSVLQDIKHSPDQSDLTRNFVSSLKVLIVDSVSALASPILGGSSPQGHALLMHLAASLRHLAVEQNMAVVVTNHMVMGDDGNLRPALGESWKAVPHARVLVEKEPQGSQCTATLVKHSRLTCGRMGSFSLTSDGLAPVT